MDRCHEKHPKCHKTAAFNLAVFLFLLFTAAVSVADEHSFRRPVHIAGGHAWGFQVTARMLRAFCEERGVPEESFAVERWADRDSATRFAGGEADVLIHYAPVDIQPETEEEGEEAEPFEKYIIGQARAALIVNSRSPVTQMSLEEVRDMLRSPTLAERVAGAARGTYYGEPQWQSISSHVVRRACMLIGKEYSGRFYSFRRDMEALHSPQAVAEKVAAERDAIGTLLWPGREMRGVRAVAIGASEDGPFVAPSAEPLIQEDYLLSEYLVLYLRPGAPQLAREFALFAAGEKGSEIAAAEGLITPYEQYMHESELRIREARSGRGEEITAVAMGDGPALLRDLARQYVLAKAAVRFSCSGPGRETLAIQQFLGRSFIDRGEYDDARDLLLLEGRPGAETMEALGEKWNELMPAEHVIGGRAVGIIVNPANRLESLTLGQVRAIFSSEVRDWAIIGGTGLPAGSDGAIPVRAAGLSEGSAADVFYRHGVSRRELRDVRLARDTAQAVAAVNMTPGAIAFVDLVQIPEAGQTVKVLPIRLGAGADAHAVRPTPENIRTGMYPFSERLYLYVHPQAGEAARDFARFAATCGKSEQTPYADTVGAVREVYKNHGVMGVEN